MNQDEAVNARNAEKYPVHFILAIAFYAIFRIASTGIMISQKLPFRGGILLSLLPVGIIDEELA